MQLANPANVQKRRHFTAVLAGDREWMPSLDAPDPFCARSRLAAALELAPLRSYRARLILD